MSLAGPMHALFSNFFVPYVDTLDVGLGVSLGLSHAYKRKRRWWSFVSFKVEGACQL